VILVKFELIPTGGNATAQGYNNGKWFIADSFSFGVERELQESGEPGGTGDVHIGVGELQECTISKSMDKATPLLAQFAVNGNSLGQAEIHFVEVSGGGPSPKPMVYLAYKLDRCFVKSWSTSGDADDRPTEEVAFYYNRVAFAAAGVSAAFSWDRVSGTPWTAHGIPAIPEPKK
jgi:type VI secretion system secreted protein Hcp